MNKKIKTIRVIFIVMSVILVLSFLIMTGAGLNQIRESGYRYRVEESDYVSALRRHDYESLLEYACDDSWADSPKDRERADYKALAGYFRTEFLRVSYEAVGDIDKAEKQLTEREACGAASADYLDYQQEIVERIEAALP